MPKSKTYEEFVKKFETKKTTDDCYTPPAVYQVVKEWACRKYGIDPEKVVRPFYPGEDYQSYDYPEGAVVVDNPPFSILTQICEWYLDRGIPFFLFAPSLTCFSGGKSFDRMNHIVCDCQIVYENGARVRTSFVTSYGGDVVAQTEPELTRLVNDEVERLQKEKTKKLPKYSYPDHIVTAALMQRYAAHGVRLEIRRGEYLRVGALDAQKKQGKHIFGYGLLLSERAAAERAAAERAAAERWKLSDREKELVRQLTEGRAGNGGTI